MVVRIAIAGARGRMGQALTAAAAELDDVEVSGLFGRPIDGDADVRSRDDALDLAEVVIDFTTASASVGLARLCADRGGPALVVGSTGFSPDHEAHLAVAAERIAIVKSGNFSLGVNMMVGLVRQAAQTLGPDLYDIEVFEAHHRRKADAPSGTALMLGRAAAAARGAKLEQVAVRGRDGLTGPRPSGAIGFSVLRGGGIVGEHSVVFAAEDEIVTLSHSARDRSLFARGALRAAGWVVRQPPGLYDMQDVMGFSARP